MTAVLYDVTVVNNGERYAARLLANNAWHAMSRLTGMLGMVGQRVFAAKAAQPTEKLNVAFCSGDADPFPNSTGRRYAVVEKPQTTAQLIDVLVKHYGSSHAVNRAVYEVWQTQDNRRKMLKVDALWMLYENIQRENSNV